MMAAVPKVANVPPRRAAVGVDRHTDRERGFPIPAQVRWHDAASTTGARRSGTVLASANLPTMMKVTAASVIAGWFQRSDVAVPWRQAYGLR